MRCVWLWLLAERGHAHWQVVIDEAHRIKSRGELLNALQQLHTHRRLLLTGSPLQNNVKEFGALITYAFASERKHDNLRCVRL